MTAGPRAAHRGCSTWRPVTGSTLAHLIVVHSLQWLHSGPPEAHYACSTNDYSGFMAAHHWPLLEHHWPCWSTTGPCWSTTGPCWSTTGSPALTDLTLNCPLCQRKASHAGLIVGTPSVAMPSSLMNEVTGTPKIVLKTENDVQAKFYFQSFILYFYISESVSVSITSFLLLSSSCLLFSCSGNNATHY